jgi:lysozyme family protein
MARLTVDEMIAEIIRKEGDYSDHPADKGGPTRFGITQAVARRAGYLGDMRHFPRGLAEKIYRDMYFTKPGFEQVHLLSVAIAEEMFDTGVNMGVQVPVLWLQRLLNVFNPEPPMVVDGVIGSVTTMALRAFLNRRGAEGEKVMVRAMNCLQGARYFELAETRPANKAFIYGWLLNRVGD